MKNRNEKLILLSLSIFMILVWGLLQFDFGNANVTTKAFSIIFTILFSIWLSEVHYFESIKKNEMLCWLLAGPVFYILLALIRFDARNIGILLMLSALFIIPFIMKKYFYRLAFLLGSLPVSFLIYYYL
jgi:hypothetical protein